MLLFLRVSLVVLANHALYPFLLIFVDQFIVKGLTVGVGLFWIASCGLEIEFYKSIESVRGLLGQLYLCDLKKLLIICGQLSYPFFEKFKGGQDMLPLKSILNQVVLFALIFKNISLVEQVLLNAEYFSNEGERLIGTFALESHPHQTDY